MVGRIEAFGLSLVVAAALALALALTVPFGGAGGARAAAHPAASSIETGVVDVTTSLRYQGAVAAGTGIVLSPSGEVLTNNHVIRGATAIHVTDVTSGRRYPATVVGYSPSVDVAVLRLRGASGLGTATIGHSSTVRLGDRVTAVGNAGGVGGAPSVTTGTVTALHRSLTVSDGQGGTERLTGLIGTSARLRPGDSGGPLLDGKGRVIGIDTAGLVGFVSRQGGGGGFAIPIDRAVAVARQIEAGHASATVHVGPTAFLGVEVSPARRQSDRASARGVLVEGVVPGSAAERAGLVPGDVITSLGGRQVTSSTTLSSAMLLLSPGTTVRLQWVDRLGSPHGARIRLKVGPPQ